MLSLIASDFCILSIHIQLPHVSLISVPLCKPLSFYLLPSRCLLHAWNTLRIHSIQLIFTILISRWCESMPCPEWGLWGHLSAGWAGAGSVPLSPGPHSAPRRPQVCRPCGQLHCRPVWVQLRVLHPLHLLLWWCGWMSWWLRWGWKVLWWVEMLLFSCTCIDFFLSVTGSDSLIFYGFYFYWLKGCI